MVIMAMCSLYWRSVYYMYKWQSIIDAKGIFEQFEKVREWLEIKGF